MDPDQPIQLVWTDGSGRLRLQDSVLYDCFLNSEYAHYPVFVLCVIGEKRRGKSFLLNYIMRALRSQEKGEALSLGADDDPLKGFDWKPGTDSTTKGIWIWNRPFILDCGWEKVAVYVLDSEGSLEIENGRETCIKLSALSMILSSHLIFNVASSLKETELDYMEMYINMGEEYESQNLQYLDILVRDWYDSRKCDRDSAHFYISREIEKLQKITRYPKVLETLKSSETRCYLLPHPGKKITGESQGRLQDMDADFQENLKEYVFDVVKGIQYRLKVDRYGNLLTCAHIPAMLQEFMEILDQQKYGFSSPMEMFYALKNQKTREDIEKQFHDFLANQFSFTLPSTVRTQASEMSSELIRQFRESLLGPSVAHHDILLQELESNLHEEQEKFCNHYTKRFTMGAVGVGLTAGLGVYGVVGAAAGKGAVVLATQPQAVATEGAVAMQLATMAVSLVKTGLGAMAGRFFR
ncbi:RING finger protein 112-like [Rhinophrynus dorsalis]